MLFYAFAFENLSLEIDPCAGFLHIFHFKIPYFSRLKFLEYISVDFQTIFMVHRALFSAFYLVYSTVTCKYLYFLSFFFIDFLEVTT